MRVAVVGATGMVGREMIKILEERDFPVDYLLPLASERSRGEKFLFKKKEIEVEPLTKESFKKIDLALFSAGTSISQEFAPLAVKEGTIVIDNSSAWRMDPQVPLVVPEVNPEDVEWHKGIIANPNCSTIQMVVILKPIHDKFKLKRVVVSTYQSVSGWGKEAVDQLWEEVLKVVQKAKGIRWGRDLKPEIYSQIESKKVLPHQIAFNVIPHIDKILPNLYSKEEMKMVNETRKILKIPHLPLTATTVRVPVFRGHAEAVNIETHLPVSPEEVKEILKDFPGVKLIDEPFTNLYPLPLQADGRDEVFVGRIRKDESVKNGINLWIVSDNLRKGAALNAIQIAELLIERKKLCP